MTTLKNQHEDLKAAGLVIAGILLNLLFANIAKLLQLPFYFDCIGTIAAAVTGGFLPGVLVGFFTNIVSYIFNFYIMGDHEDVTLFYCVVSVLIALVAAAFAVFIVLSIKPYVADRFSAWGHVWEHVQDSGGYQQVRVMTYMASGGLIGVGVGNGYLKYVFASESDLVFGLIGEEMGVIIAFAIAAAIIALAFYSRAITTRSRSSFYAISACCAAGLMVIQSALNIFGITDILPLTGVTLPFLSAGGSSMISCWGLLAFIKAADERTYAAKRRAPANALRKRGEAV